MVFIKFNYLALFTLKKCVTQAVKFVKYNDAHWFSHKKVILMVWLHTYVDYVLYKFNYTFIEAQI